MGKKKKGSVCNNPVAMARASGPAPVSGPTIRDYLARDRPSLEEATAIIQSASKRKESGALAAYEEQMNDQYREELRKQRERLLGSGASSSSTSRHKKKKRKKAKSRERSRSRSRSTSPHHSSSGHYRRKSKKKRSKHRSHYSSSSDDSDHDSDNDERGRSKIKARHTDTETAITGPSKTDT